MCNYCTTGGVAVYYAFRELCLFYSQPVSLCMYSFKIHHSAHVIRWRRLLRMLVAPAVRMLALLIQTSNTRRNRFQRMRTQGIMQTLYKELLS